MFFSFTSQVQLIEQNGYKSETHYITTEDGYILTYHRIPHGINRTNINAPAAIIAHGLAGSSADFVNLGPNRSLGYILADNGFDVWIANFRGNFYSRKHKDLDVLRQPKEFFDYSFHEMGLYDIPAAVDYILNVTRTRSLHYLGLSQGAISFLVFASEKPEYTPKIRLASLMAPGAFPENTTSLIKPIVNGILKAFKEYNKNGIYETPGVEIIQTILSKCGKEDLFGMLCKLGVNLVSLGIDYSQINQEDLPIIGMNFPNPFGLKEVEHFIHLIRNGGFRKFDYGFEKNLLRWGDALPLEYNLSIIKIPIALYFGKNDGLAGQEVVYFA